MLGKMLGAQISCGLLIMVQARQPYFSFVTVKAQAWLAHSKGAASALPRIGLRSTLGKMPVLISVGELATDD